MSKWNLKFKELCAIDIRSLALFRMGLALVILGDLFVRVQDLKAHYTDEGVLPRDVLINQLFDSWQVSLHFMNGAWQIQLILFILAALFAVALLLGYRTRLATFLSWFFLISLHTRNPQILQGGDIVLRVLLFWALFLPLGACWSIDQLFTKKNTSKQIISIASLALLLQVCFIYWFTVLLKSDASWREDGTAVWYALSIEQYSTSLGITLLQFPTLLKVMTFATFYLEAFGPFFAFCPFWTAPLRFATAAIFILFHLVGLNLTMELAHFSYICAIAWIAFIPGGFWERVLPQKQPATSAAIAWNASRLSNGLALFFIGYIFLWNMQTLEIPSPLFSFQSNTIGSLLGIDQCWDMFAPYPLKEDGWYVIPAKLRDGTEVDLFTDGEPVTWKKPPLISATYKNDRWRSYMMNLLFDEESETHLLYYGKYLTKQWNETHPYDKQVISFDIVFMLKFNSLENPSPNPQKIVLWKHLCLEKISQQ